MEIWYTVHRSKKKEADGSSMRLLFDLDKKDYADCTHAFERDSARAIIIRNGRIAMVHSLKYDYYKVPGGGIEPGETREEAVVRETLEEAGLTVIPGSVKEYGYVHRAQRSTLYETEYFQQDNYYYLCALSSDPAFERSYGQKASRKRRLYNGRLECVFYCFD